MRTVLSACALLILLAATASSSGCAQQRHERQLNHAAQTLQAHFDEVDTDKDGKISRAELNAVR
jgi:outer membrane murein-binding lipoprotein Lpp